MQLGAGKARGASLTALLAGKAGGASLTAVFEEPSCVTMLLGAAEMRRWPRSAHVHARMHRDVSHHSSVGAGLERLPAEGTL